MVWLADGKKVWEYIYSRIYLLAPRFDTVHERETPDGQIDRQTEGHRTTAGAALGWAARAWLGCSHAAKTGVDGLYTDSENRIISYCD